MYLDRVLNEVKEPGEVFTVSRERAAILEREKVAKSKSKHLGYGNVVQIYFESGVQDMAANATTLTEKMRAALRISSTSEKLQKKLTTVSLLVKWTCGMWA